jgi:hypothetical protein
MGIRAVASVAHDHLVRRKTIKGLPATERSIKVQDQQPIKVEVERVGLSGVDSVTSDKSSAHHEGPPARNWLIISLWLVQAIVGIFVLHAWAYYGGSPSKPHAEANCQSTPALKTASGGVTTAPSNPVIVCVEPESTAGDDATGDENPISLRSFYERLRAMSRRVFTDPVALFTVVLAASTILLWKETKRLAEGAEEQHAIVNRAFVYLDGFNIELSTLAQVNHHPGQISERYKHREPDLHVTRLAVQPRWKNSGNTPTKNLTIRVNWKPPGGELDQDHYVFAENEHKMFLGPSGIEGSQFIEMGNEINDLIDDGKGGFQDPLPKLFVWGRADYEDVFGKHHFTQWCYQFRPERHDGKNLRVGLIQWGPYNGTDE